MPTTPVAWSGDGLRLLAARVEEGATTLLAIDGTTGFVRTLETNGDDAVPLALSRDGRAVLATASCPRHTDGNGVLLTVAVRLDAAPRASSREGRAGPPGTPRQMNPTLRPR